MPLASRFARSGLRLAAALAAFTQISCATGGVTPVTHGQPVERMGLAPEYRIFYDALQDQGDWVYVQPYGYVFRPNVNFITWRPYEDGYWAPSDIYGWTWISAESFGWATYHYGNWTWDRYYGWVWVPGRDWGPAWVTWQINGDYAGWSPIVSTLDSYDQIRGGIWTYVPLASLGSTSLSSHLSHLADLGSHATEGSVVRNFAERGGVVYNRGPRYGVVEKAAGPLTMVKIEPIEPGAAAASRSGEPRPAAAPAAGAADKGPSPGTIEGRRRAGFESARRARGFVQRGGPQPGTIQVVQPKMLPSSAPKPKPWTPPRGDPADSTGH